nr:uncharacterized protein LOC110283279 [Parasteatoda tepidariorum]
MESIPECLTDEEALENESSELSESNKSINDCLSSSKDNARDYTPAILPRIVTEPTPEFISNSNSEIKSIILENDSLSKGSGEMKYMERLSVSLIDLSKHKHGRTDKNFLKIDKKLPYANASSEANVEKISRSFCNSEICIPKQNDFNQKQSNSNSNLNDLSRDVLTKQLLHSNSILSTDSLDKRCSKTEYSATPFSGPSRQRSASVQWIHNAFQTVEQKCRGLLDLRRPSDIAAGSDEEIEMEISEDESSKFTSHSSANGRRFSENIFGKRRLLGLGHLKGLWKERNIKRNEAKDSDQTRPDVCPLFSFPRNIDEDEKILDSLRQATRKCTAVDPSTRPTSFSVLDQLSHLIDSTDTP